MLNQGNRLFFEGFREYSVVGVVESVSDDVLSFILFEIFQIQQNVLEFDNCEGWVGVIELDGNLFGEFFLGVFGFFEMMDNVVQ